jgi:hypothetical protein
MSRLKTTIETVQNLEEAEQVLAISIQTSTMPMIQTMTGNLFQAISHEPISISGVGCLWKSNL